MRNTVALTLLLLASLGSTSRAALTFERLDVTFTSRPVAAVAFGNGRFVVLTEQLAFDHTCEIFTSLDGTTWTAHAPLTNCDTATDLEYAHGRFLAVLRGIGPNGSASFVRSSCDGASWTPELIVAPGFQDVVAGEAQRWVGIGGGASYSDDDAASWHPGTGLPPGINFNEIAFGNGVYVAIGTLGTVVQTSDGVAWTTISPEQIPDGVVQPEPALQGLQGIAFGDGKFFSLRSGRVVYLADGRFWAQGVDAFISYDAPNFESATVNPFDQSVIGADLRLAFGNGRYVAAGVLGAGPVMLTAGTFVAEQTVDCGEAPPVEPVDRGEVSEGATAEAEAAPEAEPESASAANDGCAGAVPTAALGPLLVLLLVLIKGRRGSSRSW